MNKIFKKQKNWKNNYIKKFKKIKIIKNKQTQRARANKQSHNVLSKWIKNYKTSSPQILPPRNECWMLNVEWWMLTDIIYQLAEYHLKLIKY